MWADILVESGAVPFTSTASATEARFPGLVTVAVLWLSRSWIRHKVRPYRDVNKANSWLKSVAFQGFQAQRA